MKLITTNKWWRLKGQTTLITQEICKVDTLITDQERVFFIPETNDEKEFFSIDQLLNITGLAISPISEDMKGVWGWRLTAETNKADMETFCKGVKRSMDNMRETLNQMYPLIPIEKKVSMLN